MITKEELQKNPWIITEPLYELSEEERQRLLEKVEELGDE